MKKYAIVGASARCLDMFARPLGKDYKDVAVVSGVYDPNRTRAAIIAEAAGNARVFGSFDEMFATVSPDVVIVTTTDKYHHEYIIKALDAGCDVISEKPMTIDAEKCRNILEAERRTGKRVTVTFNCRFMPLYSKIKELIASGEVGDILHINFEYMLDDAHGAEYFRRWHRKMENSHSLLVHKSTHHFDIVNWWLMQRPLSVCAEGSRQVYGPAGGRQGKRCSECLYREECKYYLDINKSDTLKTLYANAEHEDGYIRDACVFSEEIDIPDTMSVSVRYEKGTILTYSLITYCQYEGWRATITGTKGRIETNEFYTGPNYESKYYYLDRYNRQGEKKVYKIEQVGGTHGGGDERLRRMLFAGDLEDTQGAMASAYDGAMAAMIGITAMDSITFGKVYNVPEELKFGD